jgi:hypothetical protein
MSLLTEFIKHDHPRGGQAGFYNQKTDGKITMLFMGSYKSIVKPQDFHISMGFVLQKTLW